MITPLLRKMILLEEISITTSLYEHALKQLKESKKKNGRQGLQAEVNRRKADMAWAASSSATGLPVLLAARKTTTF